VNATFAAPGETKAGLRRDDAEADFCVIGIETLTEAVCDDDVVPLEPVLTAVAATVGICGAAVPLPPLLQPATSAPQRMAAPVAPAMVVRAFMIQ
jgi:hypothetical protein